MTVVIISLLLATLVVVNAVSMLVLIMTAVKVTGDALGRRSSEEQSLDALGPPPPFTEEAPEHSAVTIADVGVTVENGHSNGVTNGDDVSNVVTNGVTNVFANGVTNGVANGVATNGSNAEINEEPSKPEKYAEADKKEQKPKGAQKMTTLVQAEKRTIGGVR
jgi:hypothetical protein